jgi:hypothetical protein
VADPAEEIKAMGSRALSIFGTFLVWLSFGYGSLPLLALGTALAASAGGLNLMRRV